MVHRLGRCPAYTWGSTAPLSGRSRPHTQAARGCRPRRKANRFMPKARMRRWISTERLAARHIGMIKKIMLSGYSSADWNPPRNGSPA